MLTVANGFQLEILNISRQNGLERIQFCQARIHLALTLRGIAIDSETPKEAENILRQ